MHKKGNQSKRTSFEVVQPEQPVANSIENLSSDLSFLKLHDLEFEKEIDTEIAPNMRLHNPYGGQSKVQIEEHIANLRDTILETITHRPLVISGLKRAIQAAATLKIDLPACRKLAVVLEVRMFDGFVALVLDVRVELGRLIEATTNPGQPVASAIDAERLKPIDRAKQERNDWLLDRRGTDHKPIMSELELSNALANACKTQNDWVHIEPRSIASALREAYTRKTGNPWPFDGRGRSKSESKAEPKNTRKR